jgi:hypothetical protein
MALRKYQWVEYSSVNRNIELIAAIRHAAQQRGLLSNNRYAVPTVSEIVKYDNISDDGSVESSIVVPKVIFPTNKDLSEMISAMILGSASEIVLQFKRDVDKERSTIYGRPHEVSINTEVRFISSALLSAESTIYTDRLGAHGHGYTRSLNILIDDRKSFACVDMFKSPRFIGDSLMSESLKTRDPFLFEASEIDRVINNAMRENTTLDKFGIRVVFNQYEAFCYAHGPVVFSFPWGSAEIADENLTPFGLRIKQTVGANPPLPTP